MDDEFPDHTADVIQVLSANQRPAHEVELPNNVTVWVQTLNSFHRDEAQREAALYAAREIYRFKRDSELYAVFLNNFSEQSPEEQADYLANHEYDSGRIMVSAMAKYPIPVRPEQGKMSDEEWIKTVEKFDKELETVGAKRQKYILSQIEEKRKAALALTPQVRLDRCMKAYIEVVYNNAINTRITNEMLLRAVRFNDDRGRRYYKSIEAVEDLDDEIRATLIQKYQECDSVTSEQVPT